VLLVNASSFGRPRIYKYFLVIELPI